MSGDGGPHGTGGDVGRPDLHGHGDRGEQRGHAAGQERRTYSHLASPKACSPAATSRCLRPRGWSGSSPARSQEVPPPLHRGQVAGESGWIPGSGRGLRGLLSAVCCLRGRSAKPKTSGARSAWPKARSRTMSGSGLSQHARSVPMRTKAMVAGWSPRLRHACLVPFWITMSPADSGVHLPSSSSRTISPCSTRP